MLPHFQDERVTLYHGDCVKALRELPDCSVDSVVTDPPYGLGFMGKAWDADFINETTDRRRTYSGDPSGKTGPNGGYRSAASEAGRYDLSPTGNLGFQLWCQEWAVECLRVLKPGGHLLAFGGTRTWHRLTIAVEDAGFEVRDSIAWLYGSGFPKSHNVAIGIDKAAGAMGHRGRRVSVAGNRTQGQDVPNAHSMPEHEPVTDKARQWQGWGTALKPAFEPIVVARKPLTGTVAANVLEHGTGALNIDGCRIAASEGRPLIISKSEPSTGILGNGLNGSSHGGTTTAGRWPANVVLDEDQADALNQQSGNVKGAVSNGSKATTGDGPAGIYCGLSPQRPGYADSGGASRFFYVAKAPARERPKVDGIAHPTVKPLTLMRWLCRLVTPPGGTVLEPFAGSGTTIEAALLEGFQVVAVEREDDYLPLIAARLERIGQEPDGQLTLDASA